MGSDISISEFRKIIQSQSHKPKIWQMATEGVVSGMLTPVIDGDPDEDYWVEEEEDEFSPRGCLALRLPAALT